LDQITLYALYAAINIRCVALKAPLLTKEGWMSKPATAASTDGVVFMSPRDSYSRLHPPHSSSKNHPGLPATPPS